MRFKLIKSIYNALIVLKTIEEGGNIYVVEKKEIVKWMNSLEFSFVATVVNNRTLKFLENHAEYFRDTNVIILYPKDDGKIAEKIEKELGKYTYKIMTVLLSDIDGVELE
ncbi:hypothetical protein FC764_10305 [Clostridium botulinum]|nr:hypothetical protein [Clostridium botulinum]